MRKVTVNMYKEAHRKAQRIMSEGKHTFAEPQKRELYEAIRADGERIGKYAKSDIAYQQGLEVGFLLGVDAANLAATFVSPTSVPPTTSKGKSGKETV